MTALTTRKAWTKLPPTGSADAFLAVRPLIDAATAAVVYEVATNYHAALARPTMAESFGAYVRELHETYREVLEGMKVRRDWRALEIHSTEHTTWCDPEFAVVDEYEVCGHLFDPAVLDFPWVDNTMDRPWMPWSWDVALFPNDADDTHVFSTLDGSMAIVGSTDRIAFHGFDPALTPRSWLTRA